MLSNEQILGSLRKLGAELKRQELQGEIMLTGGAAMCLVHSARDMTKDIDALYEPKEIINRLVQQIAEEDNLPVDWLNDSVKGFISDSAPTEDFITLDGLKITTVSPEYLLAMKLISSRYGEKDAEDIRFLMKKMEIKTIESACETVAKFYPANRILPKTMYMIEECIEQLNEPEQELNQDFY